VAPWDNSAKTTGGFKIPTAEELERGQFFENRDAYDRANAGVAA